MAFRLAVTGTLVSAAVVLDLSPSPTAGMLEEVLELLAGGMLLLAGVATDARSPAAATPPATSPLGRTVARR